MFYPGDNKRTRLVAVAVVAFMLAIGYSLPLWAQNPTDPAVESGSLNFFQLLLKGSYFMIPILLMSLLVVTFAIERWIGLRRARVLPKKLISQLDRLGQSEDGFDPREAHRICQKFPSAAATVVRAMLMKIGRPQSEVEHAVAEASERESARLYANVRWLNLAAAVTPLMGLLGTVWGLIRAFHDTTMLPPGQNRADYLAQGIYVALITTLGGLLVAIPAAICSHYFEGRIQTLFLRIDELLSDLLPKIEPFEGRVRFRRRHEPTSASVQDTSQQPQTAESTPRD